MEFYYSDHTYDSTEKVLWIKDGVKTISLDMFSRFRDPAYDTLYKENNYKVIIPNSVEKIERSSFKEMEMCEVIFPDSIEEIGECAFFSCINLEEISWPSSVKIIREKTFWDCINLKDVQLPEGLREIGRFAFFACENLTQIIIPTTVEKIGRGAFAGCAKLEKIYVPRGLYCKDDYSTAMRLVGRDYNPAVIPYDEPMNISTITDTKSEIATASTIEIASSTTKKFKSFCGTIRTNLIADKRKK